jgi:hypothetical protein
MLVDELQEVEMKGAYQMFPLGLRLSHLALLRNLERFERLTASEGGLTLPRPEGPRSLSRSVAGEYIAWYVDFLDVHHHGEDQHLFPALRQHSSGRTTDAAHLAQWTREHEGIYRLAQELRAASRTLPDGGGPALERVRRTSSELQALLRPHLESEERLLTPGHLAEMIPEKELERAQLAIPKSQGASALRMAQFFVHSLEPDEQRALLGETPWFFRRIVLRGLGAGKVRRFGALMPEPEVRV